MLSGLFLSSCKKDCTPLPLPYSGNPIRFDALEVGQTSRYIGLTGEKYHANNNEQFSYTDDTLEVAIIAHDANGYLVAESMYYSGDVSSWLQHNKDSIFHYYLEITDDTLHFKPVGSNFLMSRIFEYQIGKQGLPMGKFSNNKLAIEGWKTSLPYCECRQTGYVENYSLFGFEYPYLNVLVENSAMSFDGNGETYVYAASTGIVRFSTYSWWTSDGIGWDLLTE